MFKSERREAKRLKRQAHKVHARFTAQFNAMRNREVERKQRWDSARRVKEYA